MIVAWAGPKLFELGGYGLGDLGGDGADLVSLGASRGVQGLQVTGCGVLRELAGGDEQCDGGVAVRSA